VRSPQADPGSNRNRRCRVSPGPGQHC
jgi:hypothetical protein